ncbi:hypothetical protein [Roseibium aggregatum]|uniref:hypothetical protein n=1 Tax=Roseibium aggregatum TaxID=187304 RepID=UPI003A9872B4
MSTPTTLSAPSLQDLILQSMPRQRLKPKPAERNRNGLDAMVEPWHDEWAGCGS